MQYVRELSQGGQDSPEKKIVDKLVKNDRDYTYRVEFDKGKGADERGGDERGGDGSVKLYITLWKKHSEFEGRTESEGEVRQETTRDRGPRRETERKSTEQVREIEKEGDRDRDTRTESVKERRSGTGSVRERRGDRGDKEATTRRKRTYDEDKETRKKNEDMETFCLVGKDENELYKTFRNILAECNKDWRKRLEKLDEPRPLK